MDQSPTKANMTALVLEHLVKIFPGNIRAVDDLSLEVAEGELVALVGPSGCGKTTALRLIAGLETPTGGTIAIAGRIVDGLPPKDRDVAMIFQRCTLFPHLTAYGNMAFGLRLRGTAQAEIGRRVAETAELLGIADLLKRRPGELSGGQRQRVALGRAIVRRPKLFLFDEPLTNLDAATRLQMRGEIGRLQQQLATAMIYVTHDEAEAAAIGQRIVTMRDGRI
jgi:multiple sugar transport system ATP-binding protein